MTNKVTIPDPAAYLSCCPETGRPEWSESCVCEDAVFTVEETGTISRAVVFQDDLEAYANDRVREALEALNNQAQELYESSLKSRLTRDGAADEDELKAIDLWNVESVGMAKAYTNMQKAIRALIPKEPPCDT